MKTSPSVPHLRPLARSVFLVFAVASVLPLFAATPPPASGGTPPAPAAPAASGGADKPAAPMTAAARAAATGVEVVGVHFAAVAYGGSSANTWNEAEIELNVKATATKGDSRFVSRVKVTLILLAENQTGVPYYYRASAEAVALMEGRSKVRFYLPPEVVRRDTLRAEPKLYAVDLAVEGKALLPARAASNASTPAARADFLKKAEASASLNDGILVPQYLTPFAWDNERPAPAFVRPDSLR